MSDVINHFAAAWAALTTYWGIDLLKVWCAFLLIGLAVEVFIKAEKGQPLTGILFNVRYSAIYLGMIFIISPSLNVAVGQVTAWAGAGWINLDVFSGSDLLGQIGASFVSVLVLDFFYYWWHRFQHTVPVLWDQHAVHHSDESLNVSTSMRHHWSEFIFQGLMIGLPMAIIFKLTPVNIWILSTVVSGWTWFIHMNVRLHLGWFSWVIAGPQNHRIHHSRLPQHFDKNFAAYTPVWDVIFGTYYAPEPNEYPPTGISGVKIETVAEAATYPFKRWTRKLIKALRPAPTPAVGD